MVRYVPRTSDQSFLYQGAHAAIILRQQRRPLCNLWQHTQLLHTMLLPQNSATSAVPTSFLPGFTQSYVSWAGFQVSKGEVLFITDSLGRLRKNDKISLQVPPPPPSRTFSFFPLGDTIYGIIKRMLRSTAHSLVPPRRWEFHFVTRRTYKMGERKKRKENTKEEGLPRQ